MKLTERELWLMRQAFGDCGICDEYFKSWLNEGAADGATIADVLAKNAPRDDTVESAVAAESDGQTINQNEDICGFCGLPGADKLPHPIRWPQENSAGTELVHSECEDAECKRASDLCTGKERHEFLRNCC